MSEQRISKHEVLTFLLTHIVVERSTDIGLTQFTLYQLTQLAGDAADRINEENGIVPHEVIEEMATVYLESE